MSSFENRKNGTMMIVFQNDLWLSLFSALDLCIQWNDFQIGWTFGAECWIHGNRLMSTARQWNMTPHNWMPLWLLYLPLNHQLDYLVSILVVCKLQWVKWIAMGGCGGDLPDISFDASNKKSFCCIQLNAFADCINHVFAKWNCVLWFKFAIAFGDR